MAVLLRVVVAATFAFALAVLPQRGHAQSLIRDADIEFALAELSRPLITAAGLSPNRVKVLLINDDSMNAFVVDTRHVFLHSGLVLRLQSAAQLQSVIAHELAHIANGHMARRAANAQVAGSGATLGWLLALAAALAGSPEAGIGIAAGSQSTALRNFLAHTRAEEASADQSSVGYMVSAGIDPRAATEVLEFFRGQEALSVGRQDPYVRSHPLTTDRIRALGAAAATRPAPPPNPTHEYWFRRSQGKLEAFIRAPSFVKRKIPATATGHIADMRRAVAAYRDSEVNNAVRLIDRAIADRPADPFLLELKGQILFDSRLYPEAVKAYEAAVTIAPRHALILAGLGRALLAENTRASNERALDVLQKARARDPLDTRMMRDLALAYSRAGQNAMASLVTAERYALAGRFQDARVHAQRAAGALPRGSTAWNRSQDILNTAKRIPG
ncbi:MAG: M48 family metalloprotease [Pseudomonadota bacterium]